jgi:uncharacterized membrane protein
LQKNQGTGHSRTLFQIERIAFFSDAVIAIAITLMILEIRIPELGKDATIRQVIQQYGETLTLHSLALLIGFWTIGGLWMRHHALFEHIHDYNKQLVRINLYFLFTIMLLPITISFFFASNQPQQLQKLFYFLNLFLCSLTYSLMLLLIFHRKNNFSHLSDKRQVKKLKTSSFLNVLVLFLIVVLILINSNWFYLPFLLLPVARVMFRKSQTKALHMSQQMTKPD